MTGEGVGASVMFKVILGVSAMFRVMGGGAGAAVIFKVILGLSSMCSR